MSENKIYYKGNPTTNNDYLPTSAIKNRKPKNYLVELPQGQSHFSGTRKRQYIAKHNQSQIKDTNLMVLDAQPHFSHSKIQVSDIEGAIPNTVMSQAVKNRLRGRDQLLKLKNSKVNLFPKLSCQSPTQNPQHNSQSPHEHNFHYKQARLATEQPQKLSINYKIIDEQYHHSPKLEKTRLATEGPAPKTKQQTYDSLQNAILNTDAAKKLKHKSVCSMVDLNTNPYREARESQYQSQMSSPQPVTGQTIKNMWHGDVHRIRLLPLQHIRKYNPTYLS